MAGIGNLISLVVLFVIVGGFAYVGYHMYLWSNELADRGRKKLEKKNMSFTADGGLRVNVKDVSAEDYADKTQNVLVNTWNSASFPNYKSKLGWNSTQDDGRKSRVSPSASPSPSNSSPRPSVSRETSHTSGSRPSSSALRPPEQRGSARRSASPVPGGW